MLLKIDNLSTNYLKNISLQIEDESVVILGSNGAGKTTLAKSMCGLIENKHVTIDKHNISDMKAKKRAELINFVPSKLEIFDEFIDVYEFLELNLFDKSVNKIDYFLKKFEIEHLQKSFVKDLSSGESGLILFISGLLQNSYFTIFDEPTANLDSDKKIRVHEMIKCFNKYSIVITHDLNLASSLGFRVIFLKNGQILFDGSSSDFFHDINLKIIFGDSVKKIDKYFLVNYK
ncbi:MAG: ABC transporter ATP-binding protein [Campylobacterales bacterium]|nr:ABC transporter ATP-binding protein [Campylobacterales bacterium]